MGKTSKEYRQAARRVLGLLDDICTITEKNVDIREQIEEMITDSLYSLEALREYAMR
jgi:hypothetical protein